MADTTPQQYRTIAATTRFIAIFILVAAVAVLVLTAVRGRPLTTMLPPALLLCVVAGGLLVASGGAKKKADEIEAEE